MTTEHILILWHFNIYQKSSDGQTLMWSYVSSNTFYMIQIFFRSAVMGKPNVIFVLGGPGAGKGTQCARWGDINNGRLDWSSTIVESFIFQWLSLIKSLTMRCWQNRGELRARAPVSRGPAQGREEEARVGGEAETEALSMDFSFLKRSRWCEIWGFQFFWAE